MPTNSKKKKLTRRQKITQNVLKPIHAIKKKSDEYLSRRPHRSFRLTRRRDYKRSLILPGYIAFTKEVGRTIWQYRKILIRFVAVYILLSALLVGVGSQDTYTTLTSTLRDTSGEIFKGNFAQVGQAGIILLSIAGSGITGTLTESQQIYAVILILLAWLVTVWLLRNLIAGHKVNVRDGLYNAGAPIVASFIVAIVFVIQLVPIGLAILGYTAAVSSDFLSGGVEAMLFWIAAALLAITSLYFLTSTFFAMILVTLPGMYPFRALKIAGDMVISRRVRILLRLMWMFLTIIIGWIVVMLPFILIDGWLKGMWPQIEWLPIIPIVLLILTTVTVVWMASYIYLLYRKVVDDEALPA